jgi:hypothetical protein
MKDNVYPVMEMTMNTRSIPRRMLLAVAVLAALLLVSPAVLARPNNPRVFPPNSHPFGKSYDAWAAAYLAWSDESPNAATDCAQGQQGKVWFLPSFSTDSDDLSVTVLCTVATGTGFVVPLFLHGSNAVGTCEQEVRDELEPFGGIGALEVTIDGRRIRNLSRYTFAGEFAGQETCGYILVLPPLPPGEHLVRLVVEAAEVDLQWEITVEPGGQA